MPTHETKKKKTHYYWKSLVYLPNRTENEKFPPIYRIIPVDKKVCMGKICEYGGKNKSGLLAEKKPAYGRKKNSGQ